MGAGLYFTVCFFLIQPTSLAISKEWRGSAHAWCEWDQEQVSAGWGVYPVEGDDGDGELGLEDAAPADWKKQRLPSPQQQPEGLVKVLPPEFSEAPLWESKGMK